MCEYYSVMSKRNRNVSFRTVNPVVSSQNDVHKLLKEAAARRERAREIALLVDL